MIEKELEGYDDMSMKCFTTKLEPKACKNTSDLLPSYDTHNK
jgi:hypothetical protein